MEGTRDELEDTSFHPYTSKFDYWLEGKARFTAAKWLAANLVSACFDLGIYGPFSTTASTTRYSRPRFLRR